MAIPERRVRAMLATVRHAALADDLPAAVVADLQDVVDADYVTYDDVGPDGTATVSDPVQRPLGLSYQLSIPLYETDSRFVGIGIHRADRDFTDGEVAAMELLRADLSRIVAARGTVRLAAAAIAALTDRERQILALLKTGMRDAEIGRELGLSHRTVSKHLGAVYRKLGVSSRAGAAAIAARVCGDRDD